MAKYRKLGRESRQRQAMLRALTTSLFHNGRIFTTEARAKEVRKQRRRTTSRKLLLRLRLLVRMLTESALRKLLTVRRLQFMTK